MTSAQPTTQPAASASAGTAGAILDFIVENYLFGDDTAAPAAGDSLVEAGVIDSTGVLELIEFLESEFAIVVADNETVPENLDSVENLVAYVQRKQAS